MSREGQNAPAIDGGPMHACRTAPDPPHGIVGLSGPAGLLWMPSIRF
jgi:hypothetical protein